MDTSDKGAESQITQLFDASYSRLKEYLIKRLRNESDAQDIAQEAFLQLLRIDRLDLIQEPEAYLYRIALNLCHKLMRNDARQPVAHSIETAEQIIAQDGRNVEQQIEIDQQARLLSDIIKELPPLYQAVLLMKKREGYSHQEIAEKLGISIHTVRKYLVKAVTACRAAYWEDE